MTNTHTTTTTRTRRTRSLVALGAAALLLPGLLAACSGGGPGADSTPDAGTAAKGSALASCMRDRGYDMQDPDGGSSAQISTPDGVDEEQYRADLKDCVGDGSGAGDAQMAKPMPGAAEKLHEEAACIRDGGFSDYPDDQEAMATYRPADQDAFEEVAKACSDEVFGATGEAVAP